ncbi:hypothetical protein KJ660_03290 [Candidatus Micrarchaeota archaeon]|nr:hypothetical protein [Candidatus Micrarchaeota archaeon]
MEKEPLPLELLEKAEQIFRLKLELLKLGRKARTKIIVGRFKLQMQETISALLDGLPPATIERIQGEAKNLYKDMIYEDAKRRSRERERRIRLEPKKPFQLSDAQKARIELLKKRHGIK